MKTIKAIQKLKYRLHKYLVPQSIYMLCDEAIAELKAKDEKLQQLDDAYASVVSDFESAVMELAKKDKEIEKLKKQYHQCLDDYIKCAERKEQQ